MLCLSWIKGFVTVRATSVSFSLHLCHSHRSNPVTLKSMRPPRQHTLRHHRGPVDISWAATVSTATQRVLSEGENVAFLSVGCIRVTATTPHPHPLTPHPRKDGAELHLTPCSFDVVWAGGRHAQIPVILDTETVLRCLIVTDPHTPLLCLPSHEVQLFSAPFRRYDITAGHRRLS